LVVGHIVDAGGQDLLSDAKLSLIRRAAALECQLELMEARMSTGETVDLDKYNRLAGGLRRLLETIGIERRARDVSGPTLREFIEGGTWTDEPPD
jgi:hypothetical protein